MPGYPDLLELVLAGSIALDFDFRVEERRDELMEVSAGEGQCCRSGRIKLLKGGYLGVPGIRNDPDLDRFLHNGN